MSWIYFILFACRGNPADKASIDVDGDGFAATTDCDDSNPAIHPEAAESCDGVDNNCNGQTDENVKIVYFMDADGDGFGDSVEPQEACDAPQGYSSSDGDCDDSNPSIHPQAVESCDDIDSDCDGETEDAESVDATLWFEDQDNDGFGNPAVSITACRAPDSFVANQDDCHDDDASAYPFSHATEVPFDGIDQDCDGDDWCHDLNCDGWPDLILPAYESDDGYTPDSLVFYGGENGYNTERVRALPSQNALSAAYGDFNGDGYVDIVFGAYYDTDYQTESMLFYGSSSGHSLSDSVALVADGVHRVRVADLDADGLDDIVLVSAFDGENYVNDSVIHWGDEDGVDSNAATFLPSSNSRDVAIGDFNNDGHLDVFLPGYWGNFESYLYWGTGDRSFDVANPLTLDSWTVPKVNVADLNDDGQLDLLLASYSGQDQIALADNGAFLLSPALEYGQAWELVAADLDNDGDQDIVSCQSSDEGSVAPYDVDSVIFWQEDGQFSADAMTHLQGHSCRQALVADLDQNGFLDIVLTHFVGGSMANPDYDVPIYIYYGSDSGYSVDTRTELLSYGSTESAIGDLNNDGYLDLVVNGKQDGASYVVDSFVYWGTANGIDPVQATVLPSAGVATQIQIVGAFD